MRCPKCQKDFTHIHLPVDTETNCSSCGYKFETSVVLAAAKMMEEGGFRTTLAGDRHLQIKLGLVLIAEAEVWIEGDQSVIVINPLVFGNLRPKVDDIQKILSSLNVPGNLYVIKKYQNN